MQQKIKIALLWHMHQPFYKNPYTQKIELPWVRLHGIKDYYGMVALLNDFPGIKVTYNLVPSLLVQLENYIRGETDLFQDIFSKEAQSLKVEEIHFLIRHFFSANFQNLIEPWPRYRYLYEKKNRHRDSGHIPWEKIFSTAELRDLQVWFQLCYFDETWKKNDNRIQRLLKKGENFTEGDKKKVTKAELELLKKIIPEYKKFSETGQIELSTSPFYHPILPLLIDPQAGRMANPGLPEYDLHFNWAADAVDQVESALDYMEKVFGKRPRGVWPSEGSLSMEVLQLLAGLGLEWTATDEINLARSLGITLERDHLFALENPGILYKPYALADCPEKIKIFFRDRYLSDLIGFYYQEVPYEKAAADLVARIKQAGSRASSLHDFVVPIILDGENAWEYYPNSGRDFLKEFFRLIMEDDSLETVTFSEVVDTYREPGLITQLSPGSWVNGNFDIWIGDEEDRKGWHLLAATKAVFEKEEKTSPLTPVQKDEIREYIGIAEGSDWYWWFGKENYTPDLHIFDNLFRKNLQKVYDLLALDVPGEFSTPIANPFRAAGIPVIPPARPIHPRIDGRESSYFEWLYAGCIDIRANGGTMNIANPLVNMLYYGFDKSNLYFRLDMRGEALAYFEEGYTLEIIIRQDNQKKHLPVNPVKIEYNEGYSDISIGIDRIIEIAIPLEALNLREGSTFNMQLEWRHEGNFFQVIPIHDWFCFTVPRGKDYEYFWLV